MSTGQPLADILRPRDFNEVIGQEHLVGNDGFITRLGPSGHLPSLIFWGPPGSGKTTVARLLADFTGAEFENQSAVTTTLSQVRLIIANALVLAREHQRRTILFLDEIHRFNKAQQDALLPAVEAGTITLIGATTENPSFEVISPLLSRCRVLVFKPLTELQLDRIIDRGLKYLNKSLSPAARKFLTEIANGDARTLLNILEIAANLTGQKTLSPAVIAAAGQKQQLMYDRAGEEHFNTISAFIKSLRAGQTDAALYYLARMVAAGEDPLYIARRMIVFAAEDVASPTAMVVAEAVFRACEKVGLPECRENLAAGTVYLAGCTKDRRAYDAFMEALHDVEKFGNLPIPFIIRNAPTDLMKDLGYGRGYEKYSDTDYLPDKLKGKKYYRHK